MYIVRGVTKKFKVPVAYDLTGGSVNMKYLVKNRIMTIIKKAKEKNVKISAITSDMGMEGI